MPKAAPSWRSNERHRMDRDARYDQFQFVFSLEFQKNIDFLYLILCREIDWGGGGNAPTPSQFRAPVPTPVEGEKLGPKDCNCFLQKRYQ